GLRGYGACVVTGPVWVRGLCGYREITVLEWSWFGCFVFYVFSELNSVNNLPLSDSQAPSEDFKKPVTDSGKMDARHVLQQQYMADYEKAQPIIKQTVMDTEGPDIKETYREQIRHWFIEC
ncbi:hypothetical protein scyTo_0027538, partial [Scyliorhinus torazame]|nr:hypothetical protein [Scyliorhinus torazame]